MSRSLKKGPFVEKKLFDRIEAMNAKNEKKVLKTWSRASTIFPEFVGHTIAVTTVTSTFRYMLPRIWSGISSASSLPRGPSRATPGSKTSNNGN